MGRKLKRGLSIFLFLVVITLFSSISVSAYPIIVSEQGVNHTKAKQLVYSIPEEYYEYVDVIEFVNEPIKKYNWISDTEAEITYYGGWYWAYWDRDHNCFNGKIWIYDLDYLVHELGHIYWNCILKQSSINEEFANDFKI